MTYTFALFWEEVDVRWLKLFFSVLYCLVVILTVYSAQGSCFFDAVIFLPVCSWVIVLFHELSHLICFRLFGFKVKEIRVGLLLFSFEKKPCKLRLVSFGMFQGFCVVENTLKKGRVKLLFALAAGGMSGLLLSFSALKILLLNIIPERWNGGLISLFCVGIYSFFVTLLSPKGSDGKCIREIMREGINK